jgi:hypothetical protein
MRGGSRNNTAHPRPWDAGVVLLQCGEVVVAGDNGVCVLASGDRYEVVVLRVAADGRDFVGVREETGFTAEEPDQGVDLVERDPRSEPVTSKNLLELVEQHGTDDKVIAPFLSPKGNQPARHAIGHRGRHEHVRIHDETHSGRCS